MKVTDIRLLDYGHPRPDPTLRISVDFDGARLTMDHQMAPQDALRLAWHLINEVASHHMPTLTQES